MKHFLKLAGIAFISISFFTACDAFVLIPALNLNPDDPDQAFGRLRAGIIDDGTIRVVWDWYDLERVVRGIEPVYDEIVIKHNRGNYPASRIGGETFEIKNWDPAANPLWAATFSDLKGDREHYFALYAHEKDGRWVGPMYTSRHMEGFGYDIRTGSFPTNSISATISTGATPGAGIGNVSGDEADLYYFQDFWEDEIVMSAHFIIDFSSIPANDTLLIYPLRGYIEDSDLNGIIDRGIGLTEFNVDRSVRIEYPVISGDIGVKSIDITKVLAKAQYHGHNGILLKMAGTTSVTFVTPPSINVELAGNW